MQTTLLFISALLLGYALSGYLSRPVIKNGKLASNRLPKIKFLNFEILPNLRIHFRKKTYWFHHWFLFSLIVLVGFIIYDGLQGHTLVKFANGIAAGSIFQGLRYPDRFKFRHPRKKD